MEGAENINNELQLIEQNIYDIENQVVTNRQTITDSLNNLYTRLQILETWYEHTELYEKIVELLDRIDVLFEQYPQTINISDISDINPYDDSDEELEEIRQNLGNMIVNIIDPEEQLYEDIKLEIKNKSDNYEFESIEIDETMLPEKCFDIILFDTYNINEYLRDDINSIMFVNVGSDNTFDVLCYTKQYIEEAVKNYKNTWFYECTGPFKINITRDSDGNRIRTVTNDRQIFEYNADGTQTKLVNNETYLKLPVQSGFTILIPMYKIQKILDENNNNRIYYIVPELDSDGNKKVLTHTISYQNIHTKDENYVSSNHCQDRSNEFVYDLKICNGSKCVIGSEFNLVL